MVITGAGEQGRRPSALPGSPEAVSDAEVVRLGDLKTLYHLSVGDYDGDGVMDVIGHGPTERTLLLGGKPPPRAASCPSRSSRHRR